MPTVCIFGDSITWGSSDPEGGGWVTRLRNIYEAEGLSAGKDIDVYNLGVSGDNTDDLLKRFKPEAVAREADTILFSIGINDSQFIVSKNDNGVPISKFEKNLKELMSEARALTPKVAFIGLTPVDESKTTPIPWNIDKAYKKENRDRYDEVIKKICKVNGLPYLDMEEVITTEDLSDGLHPNSRGHIKIFETVKDFIARESLI